MKNPKFLVTRDENDLLSFQLTARNGQILLDSPQYESLEKCQEGIRSIREHAADDDRYLRHSLPKKKWYFELASSEGTVLATGRPYTQRHGCERGVRAVKRIAPAAPVENPDGSVDYVIDPEAAPVTVANGQYRLQPGHAPSGFNSLYPVPGDPQVWVDHHGTAVAISPGANGSPIPASETPVLVRRKTTLQGRVVGQDGKPISGVWITVPGQTTYGHVLTRGDGSFLMPVYGGGVLPIRYERNGYRSEQRRIYVHWQDFFRLPDVVMSLPESAERLDEVLDPVGAGSVASA